LTRRKRHDIIYTTGRKRHVKLQKGKVVVNTRFRKARIQADLTQSKLAQLAKTTERNVQRIEKGEQDPRTSLSLKFAHILNTTVEALFPLPEEQALKQKPDCSRTRKVS